MRTFDGDVHGRVAGTDDDHIASLELITAAIVVGVDLFAVEVPRVFGVGPPSVPVVSVGDHHGVVVPSLGTGCGRDVDVPTATAASANIGDLGVEGDRVAESEVFDVVAEVVVDLIMAGVVRVVLGHGEVREGHARARSVDLQGLIARACAVGVVEEPRAPDFAALLEAVERDGRGVEGLRGGDPRGSRPDDAHTGQRVVRRDGRGHLRGSMSLSDAVRHVTILPLKIRIFTTLEE